MRSLLGVVAAALMLDAVVVAQEGAVARVVAARGAQVDIEVVTGGFVNGPVDLFAGGKKTTATLALPPTIDLTMSGDRLTVTLTAAAGVPLVGAIIGERGRFADAAAATRAAGGGAAPAATQAATPKPAAGRVLPPACPYTAAELRTALGLTVGEGQARPAMPFSGGASLGCVYSGSSITAPTVRVNQTVMDDPAAMQPSAIAKMAAGTLRPVPNDPDGAVWQEGQGDNTNATLQYVRKGAMVEVRVTMRPTAPGFAAMQQKLAALRRLP